MCLPSRQVWHRPGAGRDNLNTKQNIKNKTIDEQKLRKLSKSDFLFIRHFLYDKNHISTKPQTLRVLTGTTNFSNDNLVIFQSMQPFYSLQNIMAQQNVR